MERGKKGLFIYSSFSFICWLYVAPKGKVKILKLSSFPKVDRNYWSHVVPFLASKNLEPGHDLCFPDERRIAAGNAPNHRYGTRGPVLVAWCEILWLYFTTFGRRSYSKKEWSANCIGKGSPNMLESSPAVCSLYPSRLGMLKIEVEVGKEIYAHDMMLLLLGKELGTFSYS